MKTHWKLLRLPAAILICGVLLISLPWTRRPVAVCYHLHGMKASFQEATNVGPSNPNQGNLLNAFVSHRDALVRLDYFECKAIPLRHIQARTPEYRSLWKALSSEFPDLEIAGRGYNNGELPEIVIWAKPEQVKRVQDFISAIDIPRSPYVP